MGRTEEENMAGIVGYGAYIPNFRLRVEEIWDVWTDPIETAPVVKKKRGLTEKAVGRWDEDAITMAISAAKSSLAMAAISGGDLNALYFGSCTNPFASKPSAPVVAEALRTGPELMAADCQFATKSGTATLQICRALVESGMARYGLAIGSDALSRHVPPHDPREYAASCGAGAFIVGKEGVIAEIEGIYSWTTQTPEFYRLDGERYIKHAANENEEPLVGYGRHVKKAVEGYMKKFGCNSGDFVHVAMSQPDGQLPLEVGKEMGFSEGQMRSGLIASEIGDCGSASPLLALAAILDQAQGGERILLISYGFGAGCDVFGLKTTALLKEAREKRGGYPSVRELIDNKENISYVEYLRQERKLIQEFV
jgi:hydroxymethylglutaryl-CoA synthase